SRVSLTRVVGKRAQRFVQGRAGEGLLALQASAGNAAVARALLEEGSTRHGLPRSFRADMESAFGRSFGGVCVRSGVAGNGLARASGETIELAPSTPAIESPEGRVLVAHELAHVV